VTGLHPVTISPIIFSGFARTKETRNNNLKQKSSFEGDVAEIAGIPSPGHH
jgi:hypothetical protein